jgi:hypothetical protein
LRLIHIWTDNPDMDRPKKQAAPETEAVRAKLQALSRAEALDLAQRAGLSGKTVEKFRRGHIIEPSVLKLQAIKAALRAARRAEKPGA